MNLTLRLQGKHRLLLEFYKRLIGLRKEILPTLPLTIKGRKVRLLKGSQAISWDGNPAGID